MAHATYLKNWMPNRSFLVTALQQRQVELNEKLKEAVIYGIEKLGR